MRLTGGLAESWRLVSPTTYQFKLRRGVKFHNGEPFNADAVKFSIERQLNHPKSRAKAALAPVERVEVVDEHTVNVVSKGPFPVLLARTTYAGSGSVVMLPPKYVQEKGDDFALHPIGTGAFKFVEWVKGDRVTLEANPDYWRGKPKVQRVTFRFVPETATRIASLLNGETDIIENVPPDQVERVAGEPERRRRQDVRRDDRRLLPVRHAGREPGQEPEGARGDQPRDRLGHHRQGPPARPCPPAPGARSIRATSASTRA